MRTHSNIQSPQTELSGIDLPAIEHLAVELASLAGAEIAAALGSIYAVRYKTGAVADEMTLRDPVSEIDNKVETLIRARLAESFPEHDIIGEEIDEGSGRERDIVWAVDPIDGTANFVNGLPLFAASIGVLHRGRPIAGAIWCAASHKLRSGVYHAHVGGTLYFDGEPVIRNVNPAVRRRLAGLPRTTADGLPWDVRKTGSAAIECAFAAAGLLDVAVFENPNIWDVAAGIALVRAAGGEVMLDCAGTWQTMQCFELAQARKRGQGLRSWHGTLVLGNPQSVALMCRVRTKARQSPRAS